MLETQQGLEPGTTSTRLKVNRYIDLIGRFYIDSPVTL
jgi:hypothetical protein